jgi:hypothetical protein
MLKKIVVIGGIAAVAGLGLGGVAMANSNSPATVAVAQGSVAGDVAAPAAVVTSTAKPGDKVKKARTGKRRDLERRLEGVAHAQWVRKDGKTGSFVTHDAVRGDVSSISGTSITIKAADGTSETFVVNGSTKVHIKGVKDAAKTPGSISKVKVGDRVGVLGTGTPTMTATQVLDRGVAGTHQSKAPKTTATAPTTS